jgi:hypothetical protein
VWDKRAVVFVFVVLLNFAPPAVAGFPVPVTAPALAGFPAPVLVGAPAPWEPTWGTWAEDPPPAFADAELPPWLLVAD